MAESLFNTQEDKTPVWLSKPGVEPRVFPASAVKKLLADKNKGWEVCDPEFTPSKRIRPTDDGKTHASNKNANTELTGRQLEAKLALSFTELKQIAEELGIESKHIRSKKGMLELLEREKKLY